MTASRFFLFIAISLLLMQSCTKDTNYISTIPASENPYLLQIDSFSATGIIYRPDSFTTTSKTLLFAGHYKDEVFGETTATPYFKLALPSSPSDVVSGLSNVSYYDSLVLELKMGTTYYGDTNSVYKLGVYRLTDNITNEYNTFYNTTSFATNSTPLGTVSVINRPSVDSIIRIKLDNSLGLELLNLFKANSTKVTDNAVFQDYFRGLSIVPDVSSSVIYGVYNSDSGISLKLHYHDDVGVNQDKSISFSVVTDTYSFYNLATNRTGTPLAALDTKTEIAATDMMYNQELTQVRTRVSFPYLKDLQKTGNYVKVLNAYLSVKPKLDYYTRLHVLPTSVNYYNYLVGATLDGPLAATGGTTSQTGSLVYDDNNGDNTGYSYEVLSFVENELTASSYTTKSIVLETADPQTSIRQLVAGMPGNGTYKSKLSVGMLIYNK